MQGQPSIKSADPEVVDFLDLQARQLQIISIALHTCHSLIVLSIVIILSISHIKMHSIVFFLALLGSALALPQHPTAPLKTGTSSKYTPSPTPPLATGAPVPPNGSHPYPPGGETTITETITKTTFVPCSTPVNTYRGTTYYSTWLTTSLYTTTTHYTTSVPAAASTTPAPGGAGIGPGGVCPPAPTVTVTVTPESSGNGNGERCEKCQTITYINIYGVTTTIVVPPPTTSPHDDHSHRTTTTTTHTPATSTRSSRPSGTAPVGTGSRPSGTGHPVRTSVKPTHG